ncbi:MAG: hypothetical protein ABSF70_06670 [Terracidiphilus sp.]
MQDGNNASPVAAATGFDEELVCHSPLLQFPKRGTIQADLALPIYITGSGTVTFNGVTLLR